MGKRTVRWNKIKDPKYGRSSCDKCMSIGLIQEHDYDYNKTYHYYCDCYFGQQAKERDSDEQNRANQRFNRQ